MNSIACSFVVFHSGTIRADARLASLPNMPTVGKIALVIGRFLGSAAEAEPNDGI